MAEASSASEALAGREAAGRAAIARGSSERSLGCMGVVFVAKG
jgi:hypothetical protein